MTRNSTWPTWFDLRRHDGDDGDDGDTGDGRQNDQHDDTTGNDAGQGDEAKPKPGDQLGDAGKAALAKERADRKAAQKLAAEQAKKLAEYEDRDKSETEKLAAKAEAAEKAAAAATARAIRAEIKALAEGFADRSDAVLYLGADGDLTRFVGADGEVDAEAIDDALADVLKRKPHLAKPAEKPTEPAGHKRPAPDASQGRGGDTKPTDFRTASPEAVSAELAKYGMRPYGQ